MSSSLQKAYFKTIIQKKTAASGKRAMKAGRRPSWAQTIKVCFYRSFHIESYVCKELSAAGPAALKAERSHVI
jgi:hypothetical protein